jgi:hypothetical protein
MIVLFKLLTLTMVGVENQPKLLQEFFKMPTNIISQSGSFGNGYSNVVTKN